MTPHTFKASSRISTHRSSRPTGKYGHWHRYGSRFRSISSGYSHVSRQLINFRYMPLPYRVPFQSTCGVFWTLYLSIANSKYVQYELLLSSRFHSAVQRSTVARPRRRNATDSRVLNASIEPAATTYHLHCTLMLSHHFVRTPSPLVALAEMYTRGPFCLFFTSPFTERGQ